MVDYAVISVNEKDDHQIECEIVPENMKECVVSYDSKRYPGRVTGLVTVKVRVMELTFQSCWKWWARWNFVWKKEYFVKECDPPVPVNARGKWKFNNAI